jgi:hypothetical protein
MSKFLILGLVIAVLLLIIVFLTVDKLVRTWRSRHRHTFDPNSDCQFFVGQDRYELMEGNEVCIGQNITVSFAKNTQATIRVRGDVSGDVITDRGDVTITGNVGGEIKSRFGDVIVNGDCGSITTYSGDAVISGNAQGSVTSQSGNISIEQVDDDNPQDP